MSRFVTGEITSSLPRKSGAQAAFAIQSAERSAAVAMRGCSAFGEPARGCSAVHFSCYAQEAPATEAGAARTGSCRHER
jgi:hypothetical protein